MHLPPSLETSFSYRGAAVTLKPLLGLRLWMQRTTGLVRWGSSSPPITPQPQLAPFWEMLQPMRNLQYSFSSRTGMLSRWTALQLRRLMGSITEALWREPRNGLRSAPGPTSAGDAGPAAGLVPHGGVHGHGHGHEQLGRAVPAAPFLACSHQRFALSLK